jgi:hypothetical protein
VKPTINLAAGGARCAVRAEGVVDCFDGEE